MPTTEASGANALDFSFLDNDRLRSRFAGSPGKMTFYVGGISCGGCVRKLESLPLSTPGLLNLTVDLNRKLATVEVDPARISFNAVAKAVRALGFDPVPLEADTEAEALRKRESRAELVRLAVAAACAGNIMTFAFANYFGASGEWASLFNWLSFGLYLPVVTYVAWPFYRGAITSLRSRRVSIDLPMAVASLAGFVFSTVQLVRGQSDIYYDSLAGFLFLILVSRWAQRRLQSKFLEPGHLLETLHLTRARVITGDHWQWRPSENLMPGQEIVVAAGETVPADSTLTSTRAHVSLAWLTGEADAKVLLKGAGVPAGARLMSGEAAIKVIRPLEDTGFGQLLTATHAHNLSHTPAIQTADRWAQRLLISVFLVAASFLVLYWPHSPVEAVRRALALIIIACPCAMAFGTPLALAASIRLAGRRGLVVRDGGVFERALSIGTIFFDKTGTLTDTELTLVEPANSVPDAYKNIILALENQSLHPMAFAFRKSFSPPGPLLEVENWLETPGLGVEGEMAGRHYRLGKVSSAAGLPATALFCDGRELARFHFTAALKKDSLQTIGALRAGGYRLHLISGDQAPSAHAMGQALGFKPDEIHAALSPAEKARMIEAHPGSMMIGDGINDTLALIKADIGVAACGGVDSALKSSHMYLSGPSLAAITDFFSISRRARRLIRRNLALSAVYNLTAGTLALLGFINPYVAALLMPVSSGIILLNTWVGSRE